MKQWKRLIYYILLNVIVSAITTFSVLLIWDRLHAPIPGGVLAAMAPKAAKTSVAPGRTPVSVVSQVTQIPATPSYSAYQVASGDTFESIAADHNISVDELIRINGFSKSQPLGEGEVLRIPVNPEASVVIDTVIGPGDIASERVVLKGRGDGEIPMAGWQLDDGNGHNYTFPEMSLFKSGAVNVNTQTGNDTVVDLYWGLTQPIWSSGKTVTLRDAQGNNRATYIIP